MASLKEQIGIIDEAYLAGIANRGIVGRAQKDIDASGVICSLSDSVLEAVFADGTRVVITDTPANFKCSCPSRTMCKHAVMALLQASRDMAAAAGGAETKPKTAEQKAAGNFNYLLEYTGERLVKEFGKSAYNDALFKVQSGGTCEFEEASILGVTLADGAFTVRFLPDASLSESVCSCKAKNCRHRLEAVLHYVMRKTGKLEFELVRTEGEVDTEILPKVSDFIEEIFLSGLFRLSADYSEKCSQFAVMCHGAGFAAFEKMFESCGRELALYEQKSAGFNKNALIRNLTRVYQMCGEISRGGNEKALAGKFKRQYMEMPKLRVLGLGAYPWYAKSGFCGVTALFSAPELWQTFSFSAARPAASEKEAAAEIEQTWRSKSAWNLPVSLGALSKGELALSGAKISDDGRLSSSENTAAALIQPQTVLDSGGLETSGIVFDDFSQIKKLFSAGPDGPRMVYAILKTTGLGGGGYNQITQTYTTTLIDALKNSLRLTIKYSKINETAILNFEYMERSQVIPAALTVSIAISDESFEAVVFPVAVWIDGAIKNIGEEKLFSSSAKSEFAKFFEGDKK